MLNMNHAHNYDQIKKMELIRAEGVCPFCPEHLARFHDAPIEDIREWWSVTKNDFPYDGAVLHYLLIHNRHITNLSLMSYSAWAELLDVIRRLCREFCIPAGAFVLRFGPTEYTKASIEHLHAHFIVGGKYQEGSGDIIARIGYKHKK